jgi:hypothetical protein
LDGEPQRAADDRGQLLAVEGKLQRTILPSRI